MNDWQGIRYHRRSIRLKSHDFSQAGAYFFTLCIRNRECLLGEIVDGEMHLSEAGRIVQRIWEELPEHYPHVGLDAWVVMPNHVHGVVIFADPVGAIHESPLHMTNQQRRNMALPKLIGRLKMVTAKRINQLSGASGTSVWQRNYYEHIIRDEDSFDRIRQYIAQSPARWAEDRDNPARIAFDAEPMGQCSRGNS